MTRDRFPTAGAVDVLLASSLKPGHSLVGLGVVVSSGYVESAHCYELVLRCDGREDRPVRLHANDPVRVWRAARP